MCATHSPLLKQFVDTYRFPHRRTWANAAVLQKAHSSTIKCSLMWRVAALTSNRNPKMLQRECALAYRPTNAHKRQHHVDFTGT